MSDPSWESWKTLASIAVTVVPAVLKFRAEISRAIDVVAEFVGLVVMIFGLFFYATTIPQLERLRANLAPISAESPWLAAQQVHTLYTLYAGSIALMVVGGFLALSGLLGRMHVALRRR